jgi:glutamate-5-semialdehyde dehydrogenase
MDSVNIVNMMQKIGKASKEAARILAGASTKAKNKALRESAVSLRYNKKKIILENNKDMKAGLEKGLSPPMLDRLELNDKRIEAMADGLDKIADLPDPIGTILEEKVRPNGLIIQRMRVPLGVIGVIYESRPNVTADAGSLCLKAGNAAILRGGSESIYSSGAIINSLKEGLEAAELPKQAIQIIPTTDRAAVGEMLTMIDYIDVIVPRGGKSLIERITAESRVPLFKHLEGNCHSYVNVDADKSIARKVVLNAKMRRTGICGATETLLIDAKAVGSMLGAIVGDLVEADCEVRGDAAAQAADSRIKLASDEDWDKEYLDSIISVKVVNGIDEAIAHIDRHGSNHTDCIITENSLAAERFINKVDSAIVIVNASTQFADGGEFGMGAEIGISTGKLHARGPVGVEQLTSSKYVVRGSGQTRP